MVIQLIKFLFSFLNKKDSFLVVEILPHNEIRTNLVKLDSENRDIILETSFNFYPEKNVDHPNFSAFKKNLRKFGKLANYKIAVGIDSQYASTVYSSVSLVRNNAKDLIDESDLDNLISQAVWKFFDRHRLRVAQKLGVNDFDVLLTDVRIENVRLDGHRVLNPVGFKARTIEIQLCETFTSRTLINELKTFLPASSIRLISESGSAWAHFLAAGNQGSKFALANISFDQTAMFLAEEFRVGHHDGFSWGEKNLLNALVENLALDLETAKAVLAVYMQKEISEFFAKKFEKILMGELDSLAKSLNSSIGKSDIRLVYLHSSFNLPDIVFSQSFKNRIDFSVRLEPLTHSFISDNHNFHLKFNKRADPKAAFGIFVLVLEAIAEPHYEAMKQMSQIAKRRVRWLTPI